MSRGSTPSAFNPAMTSLSDVPPGSLQVGSELEMQFRIKDYDDNRGFRRYFWKPVPVRDHDGTQG